MWKLDLDDEYFRIFDSNKLIAGYFDPDYGEIFPKANSTEIIAQMLKNHDKIPGGLLMIPLVKFGLFDTDLDIDIGELESHVIRVGEHLKKWKDFIAKTNNNVHSIRISHTDQDMLTITFPIAFSEPTPLEKNEILKEIFPTLDLLQKLGLL
ncbi:hypothetical protein [Candidatus Nitrosarchaeum limnium]|jgi:hypothetical protein|uniref:Uncharacterized protein n=1 Tax=Candidatus Nitrosarchaeum limnium BG20 TaxID=859192 RepID=S2EB79_9ARCH|nr:hypothetical protein [Candidatus Nitrosarchaeum limnium]EPA06606.1 hypothetical protein BG20_I1789 [Candidatus Nitrosarchaeum limnium BG20]